MVFWTNDFPDHEAATTAWTPCYESEKVGQTGPGGTRGQYSLRALLALVSLVAVALASIRALGMAPILGHVGVLIYVLCFLSPLFESWLYLRTAERDCW